MLTDLDLKPCPFCGGKAHIEKSARLFINGQSTRGAYVHCWGCNARTKRIPLKDFGKSSRSSEAVTEAVKAWNTRCYE